MSENVKAQKLRIEFEKRGRLRFVSHLDLLRVMQRVFKRAGVPLWHSEGFNPHPYIAFGQPLSLGQEGLHELVDTALTEVCTDPEALCAAINAAAPEGLRALRAYEPVRPVKEIAFGVYESFFPELDPARIPEMATRLSGSECIVQKKNGHGTEPFDILPLIERWELVPQDGGVLCRSVLACAPSRVLNVNYLALGLLGGESTPVFHTRVRLLDAAMENFA